MTNFEAAVELSLNNWVASLPTEFVLPEPTVAYKKGIEKLMDKMRGDRYHRLTRGTARTILIAAIIIALATVVFAATVGRDFIVQKFSNYSTYRVIDSSDASLVDNIEIGYIPEGFELTYRDYSKDNCSLSFESPNGFLNIYKIKIDSTVTLDTEYKNSEVLTTKNFQGVYFEDINLEHSGIIWNNGTYIYNVDGNISKEELIKIAESIT